MRSKLALERGNSASTGKSVDRIVRGLDSTVKRYLRDFRVAMQDLFEENGQEPKSNIQVASDLEESSVSELIKMYDLQNGPRDLGKESIVVSLFSTNAAHFDGIVTRLNDLIGGRGFLVQRQGRVSLSGGQVLAQECEDLELELRIIPSEETKMRPGEVEKLRHDIEMLCVENPAMLDSELVKKVPELMAVPIVGSSSDERIWMPPNDRVRVWRDNTSLHAVLAGNQVLIGDQNLQKFSKKRGRADSNKIARPMRQLRERRLREGTYGPGENTIAFIYFEKDVAADCEIVSALARSFGGRMLGGGMEGCFVGFFQEKNAAIASEFVNEVRRQGLKAVMSAAGHVVKNVANEPVLLGAILSKKVALEKNFEKYSAENVFFDDLVLKRLDSAREKTEVDVCWEKKEGNVYALRSVERSAELYLESDIFVGRKAEMKEITEFIESRDRNSRVKMLIGRPGNGKSTLLKQVEKRLRPQGGKVIYLTASPGRQLQEGWLILRFVELLKVLDERFLKMLKSGDQSAEFPELANYLAEKEFNEAGLVRDVCQMIKIVAEKHPHLLCFLWDNLETADMFSARIFNAIALELPNLGPNIVALGAARSGSGERIPAPFMRWFRGYDQGGNVLQIRELDSSDSADLIAGILTADVNEAREVIDWIARKSVGNPLSLIGITRALRDTGMIRRSNTGEWYFMDRVGAENLFSKTFLTTEEIVREKIWRLFEGAPVEELAALAYWVALESADEATIEKVSAAVDYDQDGGFRRYTNGFLSEEKDILKRDQDGTITLSHLLIGRELENFLGRCYDPGFLQATHQKIAEIFDAWLRQASDKNLAPSALTIYNHAKLGRHPKFKDVENQAILERYGPQAVALLLAVHANQACSEEAFFVFHNVQKRSEKDPELLCKAATALTRLDRNEKAVELLKKLRHFAQQINDFGLKLGIDEQICNSLYLWRDKQAVKDLEAWIKRWQGDLKAAQNLDEAEKILQGAKIRLYQAYLCFRKNSYMQAAEGAKEIMNSTGFLALKAEAQRLKGLAAFNAMMTSREAIPGNWLDQEGLEAAILVSPELKNYLKGAASDLETYINTVESRQIAISDRTRLPAAYEKLAYIYFVMGNKSRACELAEQACQSADKANLVPIRATVRSLLGYLYSVTGKLPEAYDLNKEAVSDANSADTRRRNCLTICLYNFAKMLVDTENYDEAWKYAEAALEFFGKMETRDFAVTLLPLIGKLARIDAKRAVELLPQELQRKVFEGANELTAVQVLADHLDVKKAEREKLQASEGKVASQIPAWDQYIATVSGKLEDVEFLASAYRTLQSPAS